MKIQVFDSKQKLGKAAAEIAARAIRRAIAEHGQAYVIAATGVSQFEFLEELVRQPDLDWAKVTFFHLDEYVGIPDRHPASFRKYLREHIVERVHPGTFHFINGEAQDPEAEARRLGQLISPFTIDVAFVGIGENGHLAFNDPPADFETEEPYLIVELDEACRRQQVGEGWFKSLSEVPQRAISMSVRQILKARKILCVAPDKRKAQAVKNCVEQEVSVDHPASILQRHDDTTIFLDSDSASRLQKREEVGA
jgi:glucosamine-6-phosphate deaminase